jgi:LysR family glycine cleavage system transcriptional activator
MQLPLTALRAFEAVVRHGSIKKAAEELNVTAAAVSYQLKYLEEYLGVSLFRRMPRGIVPSREAVLVQPALAEAFDMLHECVTRLKGVEGRDHLSVTTTSYFASLWLVPRLDQFRAANPTIDILIDATNVPLDLDRHDIDVAIRYGDGRYPEFSVERLPDGPLAPVCSPQLQKGPAPLRRPADLKHHTLLHACWDDDSDVWPTWRSWLAKAGEDSVDPEKGYRFQQGDLAIHAAIRGKGVALANLLMVSDELKAGLLAQPFELTVSPPPDYGFYFVCRQSDADRPAVKALRDWIVAEMKEGQL